MKREFSAATASWVLSGGSFTFALHCVTAWQNAVSPEAQFRNGLLGLAASAAGAVFAWYAIALTAYLRASYRENQRTLNLVTRFGPPLVRRLAASALAAPLLITGTPALATPSATEVDFTAGAELPTVTQVAPPPISTPPSSSQSAALPPKPARSITVVPGDTLWDISVRLTGDPAQASAAVQLIWEENRDVIGDDPNVIYPNQVLNIPENL